MCLRHSESSLMAIAASHPLDLPRQHLFWVLHLGGWMAYFGLGYLAAVAHGKPSGYWIVPFTAATTGALVTLGLRYLLRALLGLGRRGACWRSWCCRSWPAPP